MQLSKSTKPQALDHWDTVCSSWIWQARPVTVRSAARPMGNICVPQVRDGNSMVPLLLLLLLILLLLVLPSLYSHSATLL
jgi:hypothetical protein